MGLVMILKSGTLPSITPTPLPNPTPSGPITVTIAMTFPTVEAGIAAFFDGRSTVLPQGKSMRDYVWAWNFGDPSGDFDDCQGFVSSHLYDTAGTYQVTLTLTDDAGVASTGTALVTIDPSTRTPIYVSSSAGNDANPGTLAQPIATLAKAKTLAANNREIRLKRGDTFTASATFGLPYTNFVVTAYGTGADPAINWTSAGTNLFNFDTAKSNQITLRDFALDCPANEGHNPPAQGFYPINPAGSQLAIVGITARNLNTLVNVGTVNGLLIQNNEVPDPKVMRSYFTFIQNGKSVVALGNLAENSTGQHIFRCVGCDGLTVFGNIFHDQSQANVGDTADIANCCIRIMGGTDVYIAGNDLESKVWFGENRTTLSNGVQADPYLVSNLLFRDNRLNGCYVSLFNETRDLRLTNNLMADGAIIAGPLHYAVNNGCNGVMIDHNTLRTSSTSGSFFLVNAGQPTYPTNISLKNNVFDAPNLTGTGNGFANLRYTADLSPLAASDGNVVAIPAQSATKFAVTQTTSHDLVWWNAQSQVGTDDRVTSPTWIGATGQVLNSAGQVAGCTLNR